MGATIFEKFSLLLLLLIFTVAAGAVWFAGSRLSGYADALVKKTGMADVIIGTLLLGGVTSLPEVATTITASSEGNAAIAVNNLFGGVALQVAILAVADALVKNQSITSLIASPIVQVQAMVGILLLSIAACAMLIGDVAIGPLGVGSILILLFFTGGFFLINYFQSIRWWASDPGERDGIGKVRKIMEHKTAQKHIKENENEEETTRSFGTILKTRLFAYLALSAMTILVAGYVVVQSGQVISEKTGLGSNIMGAIFIALATSLPELSTTISAVRMQEYRLAFSNILGTNIFTIGFLFLADAFYAEGPILANVENFSMFGAMLGILLTGFYVIGMSIRIKKTFFHLGYDSLLVAISYLAGVYIMFSVLN